MTTFLSAQAENSRLRIEIDRLRAELACANTLGQNMTVGLGRAAAERDEALAELSRKDDLIDDIGEEFAECRRFLMRAEAAIARVRKLCSGGLTACVRCDGVIAALLEDGRDR